MRAKKKHCSLDSENPPQPQVYHSRPAEADGKSHTGRSCLPMPDCSFVFNGASLPQSSGDIAMWVEQKLTAGEQFMGFGYRTFSHGDPARMCCRWRRGGWIQASGGSLAVDVERHTNSRAWD
jgi:hypothetical protein